MSEQEKNLYEFDPVSFAQLCAERNGVNVRVNYLFPKYKFFQDKVAVGNQSEVDDYHLAQVGVFLGNEYLRDDPTQARTYYQSAHDAYIRIGDNKGAAYAKLLLDKVSINTQAL